MFLLHSGDPLLCKDTAGGVARLVAAGALREGDLLYGLDHRGSEGFVPVKKAVTGKQMRFVEVATPQGRRHVDRASALRMRLGDELPALAAYPKVPLHPTGPCFPSARDFLDSLRGSLLSRSALVEADAAMRREGHRIAWETGGGAPYRVVPIQPAALSPRACAIWDAGVHPSVRLEVPGAKSLLVGTGLLLAASSSSSSSYL